MGGREHTCSFFLLEYFECVINVRIIPNQDLLLLHYFYLSHVVFRVNRETFNIHTHHLF